MNISLLRHGIAAPLTAENHYRDEMRELTTEGQSKMRRAAQGMKRLGLSYDVVATSPLIRCSQTADIVVQVLGLQHPIRIWNELAPEGDVRAVLQKLQQLDGHGSVLTVGHQPGIGCLAAALITGESGISLPFRKGSLWGIQSSGVDSGELEFMLTSKMLRQIAQF